MNIAFILFKSIAIVDLNQALRMPPARLRYAIYWWLGIGCKVFLVRKCRECVVCHFKSQKNDRSSVLDECTRNIEIKRSFSLHYENTSSTSTSSRLILALNTPFLQHPHSHSVHNTLTPIHHSLGISTNSNHRCQNQTTLTPNPQYGMTPNSKPHGQTR